MIYFTEDDTNIRELVVYTLKSSGFDAKGFTLPSDMFDALEKEKPELILLDIMLPETDGLTVLKKLKYSTDTASIPVILVTAKDSEFDKVIGLDSGADDYITKPYNPMELVARVRSNLRRYMQLGAIDTANKTDIIEIGGLELDTQAKSLKVDGEPVKLTATELKILELLMKNAGRIFSAEEIYSKVWNEDAYAVENTVMVHIRHIREKIEINPREPKYLKVVWGIGYKIEKI